MKQRLLLCLLLAVALIYLALPRLPIYEGGVAQAFAVSWLLFSLIVVGSNLSSLLYSTNRADVYRKFSRPEKAIREKRTREYS